MKISNFFFLVIFSLCIGMNRFKFIDAISMKDSK